MVQRTLFKKIHGAIRADIERAHEEEHKGNAEAKAPRTNLLPLQALHDTLADYENSVRENGDLLDDIETECVVSALIANGYMKGYSAFFVLIFTHIFDYIIDNLQKLAAHRSRSQESRYESKGPVPDNFKNVVQILISKHPDKNKKIVYVLEMDAHIESLIEHVESHDQGWTRDSMVVEVADFEETGRGMRAKRDIEVDEVIISIPADLAITSKVIRHDAVMDDLIQNYRDIYSIFFQFREFSH